MAETDSEKVERTGIDPTKGSVLSKENRNDLFKRFTVESSIFRNDLTSLENSKREEDLKNTSAIQEQEQVLIGVNTNIQSLRDDIGKLGAGLASIALLLQQDSAEEQSRIKVDQEKQRRLAEQQIRIGKENEIEQKIQNAILEPVQRLVPKVDDIFGNIGRALSILFGGWLTNQVVQAIKASEENNTKLFNEIKFNILKNLAIVGGGLFAIRAGFSLITRTIGSIASGLTRLLIAKPLAIAAALLPRVGGSGGGGGGGKGTKPPGTKSGGMLSGVGKFVSFLSGLMNLKNKEFVDATLVALSFAAKAPGPLGAIGKIAGIAFTADEIAEAFGKNIFDDANLNKKVDEIAKIFKGEEQNNKVTTSAKPEPPPAAPSAPSAAPAAPSAAPAPAPSSTPTPPTPTAQPQTPMMGEQKPSTSAPSPDMVSKFEQAWQYRNNSFARGRIEDAWDKMTPDQKQQAKEWASSKGYDWKEMRLPDVASTTMSSATPTSAMISSQPTTQPPEANNTSQAQMMPPSREPTQVGQLPEAKPSLTMIKTSNDNNQQQNPVLTNGPLTDVPLISSANPDNFYILYSQLSYNVVT
jgi:hypothetical protein